MKIKVKYDVLFYNGDRGKISTTYECPDFESESFDGFLTEDTLTISVEDKTDEWVSELDKSSFMNQNDIWIIHDWSITSIKKNTKNNKKEELIVKKREISQEEMVILFAHTDAMSTLKDDFLAVYSEIKEPIKNLKFVKQCDIVFKSLGVAQKASINSLDNLMNYQKALKLVNWDNFKHKNGEYDMEAIRLEAKKIQNQTTNLLENE